MNQNRYHRLLSLAALFVLLMTGCAGTQGGMGVYRFRGKVVDAETEAPIQKARIILDRYGFHRHIDGANFQSQAFVNEGVTDPQGEFQLDDHFLLKKNISMPALRFFNIPDIPKPGGEILVIFSEGHETAYFSIQSGWFSSDLIRMEWSEGGLKEVERTATQTDQNPTGFKFRYVRRKLQPEALRKAYSGYVLDLPVVRLKRIEKSEPHRNVQVSENSAAVKHF